MWLQCPSGQLWHIKFLYSKYFKEGLVGTTFLGDPIDDFGGGECGDGWEYCFSSAFNSRGDMPTEHAGGNTVGISLANGNNADGNS